MIVTPSTLAAIAGQPANDNMRSTIAGLMARPEQLRPRIRLACFLGQAAHESGCWRYDRELWGTKPTAAQARYDTRADLGNTPAADGDGYLYRGRSGFQITGRANYSAFTAWARMIDPSAPDFVKAPDAILTDPWEGLASVWYWETRDLSPLADAGNILGITRRINGGTNGLDDRIALTIRAGLRLGGYADVRTFQRAHQLVPDGVAGPITIGVMFKTLRDLPEVQFAAA